jgi:hypothetical protein
MKLIDEKTLCAKLAEAQVLPLDEKLLQLVLKVLIFAKDRGRARMSGRMELHADDSGVITKCPRYLSDCI